MSADAPDPRARCARAGGWAIVLLVCIGCVVADEPGAIGARRAPDAAAPADAAGPGGQPPRMPDAAPAVRDPVTIEVMPAVPFDDEGRATVRFDVPPDLRAVTLSADGPEGAMMVFEAVEDGSGQRWIRPDPGPIDDADRAALVFPGPFLSPNRAAWGEGVASALLPNNPGVQPAGGSWRAVLRVAPPAVDPVDVYAQIERGPVPDRGRLDLHFHFTRASDWRSASAAMDDEFRTMLNVASVLLRDVGVDVGAVTFTDVPVVTYSVSVQVELPRLLALSDFDSGVSVFVVGRIEDAVGGPLAGISGAIPASGGLPGTGANGVAIARPFADGQALGATLAHEIGHALGLFHTVEANPAYGDQLDDTPPGEDGHRNVMYPTAGEEGRRFSRQQGVVMRRGRAVDGLE